MRYDKDHESPDVVDRRGQTYRGGTGGGGGGVVRALMPLVASKFGLGGVVVLLVGYYGLQMLAGGGGTTASVYWSHGSTWRNWSGDTRASVCRSGGRS